MLPESQNKNKCNYFNVFNKNNKLKKYVSDASCLNWST